MTIHCGGKPVSVISDAEKYQKGNSGTKQADNNQTTRHIKHGNKINNELTS